MTRICLMVEIDNHDGPDPHTTPQQLRTLVQDILHDELYHRHPIVTVTAFEPTPVEPYVAPASIQAAWDRYLAS